MANTNTDQIRRLNNVFTLAGPIAEIISFNEGKSKETGIPWFQFQGVIRCGDSSVYDTRFRIFRSAKKKDGNGGYIDNPSYTKLLDWCKNCVPMTENTESPTWIELGGFIGMNDYVNRENNLIESVQYNVNWTKPFEEFKAEINLEAMIQGMKDETKSKDDDTPTGRTRIRLISTDQYGNAVDLKLTKADEEISRDLEENDYGVNSLATYYITLIPSTPVEVKQSGGIGKQRTTMGRSFLEYMITGASAIIEEDDEKNYIDPKVFKRLLAERKNKLEEIKEKGYLGGNNSNSSSGSSTSTETKSSSKSSGVGKANTSAKSKPVEDDDDDPDMPF